MKKFDQHIIKSGSEIIKAIEQLNTLSNTLTLFVIDKDEKLIGTLTDGDIRRGFIAGNSLTSSVDAFMSKKYYSIKDGIDINQLKEIRKKGVKLLPVVNDQNQIQKIYDVTSLKSVLPVHAVIMAGGRGERMRPLTDNLPKPLLPLGDKPIIQYTFENLASYGVENFTITLRYLGEQIIDFFKTYTDFKIDYINETKPLGTIGSLSLKKDYTHDYILLTNSDLFTNIDFEDLFINLQEQNADMAIASVSHTVNIPYAIFETENSVIKSFKEKPSNMHYANAGIYLFHKKLLKYIPEDTFFNATDFITTLLDTGHKVIHNPILGYWTDIGRHEDYVKAQEIVKHVRN